MQFVFGDDGGVSAVRGTGPMQCVHAGVSVARGRQLWCDWADQCDCDCPGSGWRGCLAGGDGYAWPYVVLLLQRVIRRGGLRETLLTDPEMG